MQVNAAAAVDGQLGGLEAEVAAAIGAAIHRLAGVDHQTVGADVVGAAVVGGIDTTGVGPQAQGGGGLQLAVGQADVTAAAAGGEADVAADAGCAAGDQRAAGTGADRTVSVAAIAQGHASCGCDAGSADCAIELLMATGGQRQAAADRQGGGVVEADVAAAAQGHAVAGIELTDRLLNRAADRLTAEADVAGCVERGCGGDVALADQMQVAAGADRQAAGLHDRVAEGSKAGRRLGGQHHRAIHRHRLEHRLVSVQGHRLAADHRCARFHLAELEPRIKDVSGIGHPLVAQCAALITEALGQAGPGAILGGEGFF